jgi:hypothetical protein
MKAAGQNLLKNSKKKMARAPATPTYQPVTSSAILAYFGEAEIFSSPKTPLSGQHRYPSCTDKEN